MDRKEMYLESKRAVADLVNDGNANVDVPTCPGWRVRDVLAHLVGQFEDMATGNTENGGSDEWTAAQVDRFADVDLSCLLAAWDQAVANASDSDGIMRMTVPDLVVHEFDIRGALGNRENRENPALLETAKNFIEFQQEDFKKGGLSAVRFIMDGSDAVMGEGAPGIELTTSAFEVTRLIFGRRSRAQILAMDWSADPAPWLDHVLLVPPRETSLVE